MIQTDRTQETTATTTSACSCIHLLPCGLCDITGKDCPKRTISYPQTQPNITWGLNSVHAVEVKV